MKTSRRDFATFLGASILTPTIRPAVGLSLWERVETEFEQSSEVPAELIHTLLDLQGPRGIYDDPKQFESLRAAVARAIPEHRAIRDFKIPQDIEPLLSFKR